MTRPSLPQTPHGDWKPRQALPRSVPHPPCPAPSRLTMLKPQEWPDVKERVRKNRRQKKGRRERGGEREREATEEKKREKKIYLTCLTWGFPALLD